jgi:uncharacterized protein YhbP (UPF0306 family)
MSHNVMGLATLDEDGPHSAPVFYALSEDGNKILFMSKTTSEHSRHVLKNARASACIFLDSKNVRLLHGVQITGVVESPVGKNQKEYREVYCRTYPHARLAKFVGRSYRVYALSIEKAKLIDNRLGFGKSFKWDLRQT